VIFASFLTFKLPPSQLRYLSLSLPRPKVRILLQSRHALELY
jgi:hypothetical protein